MHISMHFLVSDSSAVAIHNRAVQVHFLVLSLHRWEREMENGNIICFNCKLAQ